MTDQKDAGPNEYPAETGIWSLISPSGKQFSGESPLAAVRSEINERVPATVQLERILAANNEDAEPSATESWTPKFP